MATSFSADVKGNISMKDNWIDLFTHNLPPVLPLLITLYIKIPFR